MRSPRPSRKDTSAWSRALAAASLGLVAIAGWDLLAAPPAFAKGRSAPRGQFEYGCRVQPPQKFLERRSFLHGGMLDTRKQTEAVRYRTEHYGKPEDDGAGPGSTAFAQAKTVHFMGLPISIHSKIAPALACVEKRLLKTATGASRYRPHAIGGFRTANTYRGVEVSNHLYGIAIDIDPDKNPCCGCVDPWPSNPICKNTGSVYDRTALPKAWIKAFERFGFDWLGHDTLEDTMHFEFLGDPERITK